MACVDRRYAGTVRSVRPHAEQRNSAWASVEVLWEAGGSDMMHPWELEPMSMVGPRGQQPEQLPGVQPRGTHGQLCGRTL